MNEGTTAVMAVDLKCMVFAINLHCTAISSIGHMANV